MGDACGMFNRTARLAAILAAWVAAPAIAAPGSARDVADFTALEAQWLHAIAAHDTGALSRILAPEFRDTAWNGRVRNRAAMIARARTANNAADQRLSDIEVRRYGKVAIVTGQNNIGGIGPRQTAIRFTDVFVWRQGRWQAASAQETLISP